MRTLKLHREPGNIGKGELPRLLGYLSVKSARAVCVGDLIMWHVRSVETTAVCSRRVIITGSGDVRWSGYRMQQQEAVETWMRMWKSKAWDVLRHDYFEKTVDSGELRSIAHQNGRMQTLMEQQKQIIAPVTLFLCTQYTHNNPTADYAFLGNQHTYSHNADTNFFIFIFLPLIFTRP